MSKRYLVVIAVLALSGLPVLAFANASLISVTSVSGGCVMGPTGPFVEAWDVEPGETYLLTINNVTECANGGTDPTLNVRVNSTTTWLPPMSVSACTNSSIRCRWMRCARSRFSTVRPPGTTAAGSSSGVSMACRSRPISAQRRSSPDAPTRRNFSDRIAARYRPRTPRGVRSNRCTTSPAFAAEPVSLRRAPVEEIPLCVAVAPARADRLPFSGVRPPSSEFLTKKPGARVLGRLSHEILEKQTS